MLLLHIDAFTDRPFRGNPAAVCLLNAPRDAEWMQNVAAEMNLSETAFVSREGDAFRLRWFTPTTEVDLCGHATLASAHALWQEGIVPADQEVQFQTRSGVLTAALSAGRISLDFPSTPARETTPPKALLDALRADAHWVGVTKFDYLVRLDSEELVRSCKPDLQKMRALDMRGVIVTSKSSKYDFVSRYFAPGYGIDEDPVTGSTHCALAPFWAERLGRTEFRAYQASARGGELHVKLMGDRVQLGGNAVTVARGELIA